MMDSKQDQITRERSAVAPWQPLEFTDERLALMRKAITPPTATAEEFSFFVEWCRQTGLNPFLKQAYLIERRAKVNNAWISKHDPMVAEAGFAARADALPDFGGMRSGVVYAGDEFMIDEVTQEITHRWSIEARAKAGNKVLGAWAHAVRYGRVVEITWLTLESRIQKSSEGVATKFWASDPAGQIRKCARADQYRRAYPNVFANWYDVAEARDTEVEVNAAPTAPVAAPGDRQAKSAALKTRLGVKTVDAAPASAPAEAKAAASKPADGKAAEAKPKSEVPPIEEIRFGPHKRKLIADATTIELEESLVVAHEQLAACTGKEAWVPTVREGVDAIDAEIERREGAGDAPATAPEPGSEG